MVTYSCFCSATYVGQEEWREDLWTEVFGEPVVPIEQPFPVERAVLAGEMSHMFRLDKTRVTDEQLAKLAYGIANHFSLPVDEVLKEIHEDIVPIKADDVMVTGCRKHAMAIL